MLATWVPWGEALVRRADGPLQITTYEGVNRWIEL